MASPITRAKIAKLLDSTLCDIIMNLDTKPREWTSVYDVYETRKAFEYIEEMRTLDKAQLKEEGEATKLTDASSVRTITFEPRTYSVGFSMTEEAIDDNLYQRDFPQAARMMTTSIGVVEDIEGAEIFNNGWDASKPGPDGLALFSTDHPVDSGTYANSLSVHAGLNETSLADASILAQSFVNARGILMPTIVEKLFVSRFNQYVAEKVTESKYSPFTGNNDINTADGMISKGYKVLNYFTFPNGFFCKTDLDGALRYFLRKNTIFRYNPSDINGSVTLLASKRFTFGAADARGVVGSQGN